ncbi:MAG TPA: hypothetical protein VFE60_27120 [Roseiarcus sp.]|jgi:hypothetical protein|nr:hypothetical protein [Roseiarcus sp.]
MAFRDFAESIDFGERAQRWADALYFGPQDQPDSYPFGIAHGIRGVGLVRRNSVDFIAILTLGKPPEQRLDLTELLNPPQYPDIFNAIRSVLPDETFDRVCILPIPQIIRSASAGTFVRGALQGTAGPGVTWAGGRAGFLTAGHVAVGQVSLTDASGNSYGNVVHAFDPAQGAGSAPNVDVAVIEVPKGAPTTSFASGAPIKGNSAVDLHLNSGPKSSTVLAMIGWYDWPLAGRYVDLYMTNAACTVPGDSGSVVTSAGTSDAIGIVVGGTATFTSFIQVIDTQIKALNAVTGLNSLKL